MPQPALGSLQNRDIYNSALVGQGIVLLSNVVKKGRPSVCPKRVNWTKESLKSHLQRILQPFRDLSLYPEIVQTTSS